MSTNKTRIAFIINPVSGTKKKDHVPGLIKQILDPEKYEPIIVLTQRAGHATELAKEFVSQNVPIIMSVGGDGTVNEIGRALVNTNSAMGIIPFGSGNGLARHLGIPMDTVKAIELLNHHKVTAIDYGTANEFTFFCTCGVGFDAHIGHQFAIAPKRGFATYVKTTLREYINYKPKKYKIETGDQSIKKKAFLITFANANQWGNNAFVAPQADIQDGKIDICIMGPIHFYSVFSIGISLFRKRLNRNSHMTVLTANKMFVKRKKAGIFHIDGEPVETKKKINIETHHLGLKVAVDKNSYLRDL